MLASRPIVRLIGAALTLCAACTDDGGEFHIIHPITDSLVNRGSAFRAVVVADPENMVVGDGTQLGRLADAVYQAVEVNRIGVADGSDALTFGSIDAALMDRFGRILVLDAQALEMRVFDRSGQPLQVLGGPGDGPGRYSYPYALSVGQSGRAAVFDGRGVAHLYSLDSDSVRFWRTVTFHMSVDHGCLLGDTLVVQGQALQSDKMLHLFNLDGTKLRSFGLLYKTENARVREQISDAVIECVESSRSIIVAPVFLHEVRSYAPSGELNWRTVVEGLKPIDFRENDQGLTSLGIPAQGYHGTIHLSATPSGVLVHQIAYVTREARHRGELAGIETILLDVETGAAIYAGSRLPRIQHANERVVLFVERDPFPKLVVSALADTMSGGQ